MKHKYRDWAVLYGNNVQFEIGKEMALTGGECSSCVVTEDYCRIFVHEGMSFQHRVLANTGLKRHFPGFKHGGGGGNYKRQYSRKKMIIY
jgi:hypothetical protein